VAAAYLFLVRSMHAAYVLSAIGFVVANFYLLALWCFAFLRTGFHFAWVYAISNAIALFVGLINLTIVLQLPIVKQFLGSSGYSILYWAQLVIQPLVFILTMIGSTLLLRHLLRPAKAGITA
jgi:hypothetical protein